MTAAARNFSLKEEIRDYWSERAASFDEQRGHGIHTDAEAAAWSELMTTALGPLAGKTLLDLACGTGEISRVALNLGARVIGIDFADPMLQRAQLKHRDRAWQGWLDDVETLASLADNHVDAAATRHLVWTLTDPIAAFAAWFRVLRPGARLLIVDGDWVRQSLKQRLLRRLARLLSETDGVHGGADLARHTQILAGVAYKDGLTLPQLKDDLSRVGFVDPRRHALRPIYWSGMRGAPLGDRLRLLAPTRFALSVAKPHRM